MPSQRTLDQTIAARVTLGLLELRLHDFPRADVIRWLSDGPLVDADGHRLPAARWDRLSREGGSLEAPRIDSDDKVTFDILWCPHQDHYGAFDCRVQRYFVQGMVDAAKEFAGWKGFEVRFDTTIPSGAPTCHFTMWKPTELEKGAWVKKTEELERKALERAKSQP